MSATFLSPTLTQTKPSTDRTLGIIIAIGGSIAFFVFRNWIRKQNQLKTPSDEIHSVRYTLSEKLTHCGSCHCQRVRFKVRLPRILNAFDFKSKIRFLRLLIKCEDFENLSDEKNLSLYTVTNGNHIGIHAFCNYCGVHILFSPAEDPKEIQINVECLDLNYIEKINISYCGLSDSLPCNLSNSHLRQQSFIVSSSTTPIVDLPLQSSPPPSISRSTSRGMILPSHYNEISMNKNGVTGVGGGGGGGSGDLHTNNESLSETLSELLVDGVENVDEKQYSRDMGDIPSAYNHPFAMNQINTTRGSGNYLPSSMGWDEHTDNLIMRSHSHLAYPHDWDQDVVLHRSRQQSVSLRDSTRSSNSLSNSYTTTDSNSGNGIIHRQVVEETHSTWNSNEPSSSPDTPTNALHRRLRTHLQRHLPQNKPIPIPNSNNNPTMNSNNLSPSLENRMDRYETYDGRWRR